MEAPETRTRILDVAQDLMQRRGANAMSYQDISDAVGIRKASIHYYFPSKEDLVDAVLDRYSAYFLALVERIVRSGKPAREKLREYCRLFEATLRSENEDKACLCAMLGAELASLGAASSEAIRVFYRENEQRLREILEQGVREGDFSRVERGTAALIFSLLEGAVLIARAGGGVKQFKSIASALESLLAA